MAQFYLTSVRYDALDQAGRNKMATEQYLVDAMSFTEAEARIIEERKPYISGEFTIPAIKKSKIAEISLDPKADNRYWSVKAAFSIVDAKGTEKKSITEFLVQADDFGDAVEGFLDHMKGTVADFEIVAVAETSIMDVYMLKNEDE